MIENLPITDHKVTYSSCFDGYLNPFCAECDYWEDGSRNNGIGCARPYHSCCYEDAFMLLDEIRMDNVKEVYGKYGLATPIAVDKKSKNEHILLQYKDGSRCWENIIHVTKTKEG